MPGRNESCPCGSGLKYKKCCKKSPNRSTSTLLDFAEHASCCPCILCGSEKIICRAIFTVDPNGSMAQKMNVPINKIRNVFYNLCETCYNLPNKLEKVEEVIANYEGDIYTTGKPPIYRN